MPIIYYLGTQKGWDMSRRLVDLNISQPQDLNTLFAFVGLLLAALLINVLLFASRKNEIDIEELEKIIQAAR